MSRRFKKLQMNRTCASLLVLSLFLSAANVAFAQSLAGGDTLQSSGVNPSALPDAPAPQTTGTSAAGDSEKSR